MLKRALAATLVLLVILVSVYYLRTQLLRQGLNTVLAKADLNLVQLDGIELGWRGASAEKLVLEQRRGGARQILEGVSLSFSLLDMQAQSLTITSALINLPQTAAGQTVDDSHLLLSELLRQWVPGPLESLNVDTLEVIGVSFPLFAQPVSLSAKWQGTSVSLMLADKKSKASLKLAGVGGAIQTLVVMLTRDGEKLLQLEGNIQQEKGKHSLHGTGELQVAATFPLLRPVIDLPEEISSASGELLFELSGELDDDLSLFAADLWQLKLLPQSTFIAQLMSGNGRGSLQLGLAQAANIWVSPGNSSLNGTAGLTIELTTALLKLPTVEAAIIKNVAVEGLAQVTLEGGKLTAVLSAGEWLRADDIVQGDIRASKPSLRISGGSTLDYLFSSAALRIQVPELQLSLPELQVPEFSLGTVLKMQGLKLSWEQGGSVDMAVDISSDALGLRAGEGWLPDLALTSQLHLSGPVLTLSGKVSATTNLPLFDLEARYRLDTQRGTASLQSDSLRFNAEKKRLSRYFEHWPYQWDLLNGSIDVDMDLQWHTGQAGVELGVDISHNMTGLAGVYQKIGFIGLSGEMSAKFRSPDHMFSSRLGTITLESLDIGVPVEALEASFQFDSRARKLALKDVQARMFDGRVWLEDTVLQADRASNKVFVGVDGVQLNQLLQLAGYDAVQATGTISGLLPLDVNKAGATMKRGMLAAKAPGGVFRYKAEVSSDLNPALAPVMTALENFQYSIFQLEADYLDNGDLELAMQFRGRNPEAQQGRPIHLKLNVTDNIPALLKSLQAGKKIADSVSKRLGEG